MDLGGIGIAAPASRTARRPLADVEGPSPEYRDTIDAAVALLESYRNRIAPLDALVPALAAAQFDAAVGDLWRDWRALWSEATECLADIVSDREHVVSAKQYTEAQLTRLLLDAPLWHQAYAKPRGYPGDHLVMNYIYEGKPLGAGAFARLVHMLAIKIGEFVVRRKDFVRAEISGLAAGGRAGGELRVASLGCGPAREVAEYLALAPEPAGRLCFVLVDQDEEALRLAGRAIGDALATRRSSAPRVRVEPRKVSVLRLLRDIDPAEVLGQPDLIYSAGLFDYFSDRTCRILTKRMYDALRAGGALLLGNMKLGTDMAWPLEFIADWSLIYRSAERVLGWTEDLTDAEIRLRTEATGYDYMLRVQKPA